MAKPQSAGILLYKKTKLKGYEVLIVHPSGECNKDAAWSIPKGKLDRGETPEQAARREVLEETGIDVTGELESLGTVVYKSKKKVHCYCGKATPKMKPTCANWEVDKAEFVPIDKAEKMLHEAQSEFIKRFRKHIKD